NWGNTQSWSGWEQIDQMFHGIYRDYASRKPIMLVETASVESGGSKADWIGKTWELLEYRLPDIKAIVWMEAGSQWPVETSASSAASFPQMAVSQFFTHHVDRAAPHLFDLGPDWNSARTSVSLRFTLSEPARVGVIIKNHAGDIVRKLGGIPIAP